jgi:hypothetical protein
LANQRKGLWPLIYLGKEKIKNLLKEYQEFQKGAVFERKQLSMKNPSYERKSNAKQSFIGCFLQSFLGILFVSCLKFIIENHAFIIN